MAPLGVSGVFAFMLTRSILTATMSIETSMDASSSPAYGAPETDAPYPLYNDFEKLKREIGFVEPPGAHELLERYLTAPEDEFNHMIRKYVDLCVTQYEPRQTHNWDVYAFRGILVSISQIYFERYNRPGIPHDSIYRARKHESGHYLKTVDDDMMLRNEPSNPHLDHLLLEMGVDSPVLPKTRPHPFKTNIIQILGKIDPNIAELYRFQSKTAP